MPLYPAFFGRDGVTAGWQAGYLDRGESLAAAMALLFSAIPKILGFVLITLGITYWAARRTKTSAEFFAAGGNVSAVQNGFALAGDYMSAASFLGIAGLVATSGFDGLIYSVGWLVGWPVITFLIAEPLRNLGKYTFTDVMVDSIQWSGSPGGDDVPTESVSFAFAKNSRTTTNGFLSPSARSTKVAWALLQSKCASGARRRTPHHTQSSGSTAAGCPVPRSHAPRPRRS